VVRSSHDAIVAKDLNGIITDWNQSAERIFGYKPKEIIGKSILTLIPKDRVNEETEILSKIRRGQSIDHYETVRRCKDGRLIDVSLTISPVKDPNGKIVGVSKIARAITKEKQTERRLNEQARLLDFTNDAILVRDAQDRITYWNDGARELYGYSREEALGKVTHKLLRTVHSQSLTDIRKKLERENRWSGELTHTCKDGTKVVVISRWSLRVRFSKPTLRLPIENARNNEERSISPSRESFQNLLLSHTQFREFSARFVRPLDGK